VASDLNAAVDAAHRLVAMLDGVRVIADALTEISSIEQAINESKQRLATSRAETDAYLAGIADEVAKAQGELASAQAAVQAAQAQAAALVADGQAKSDAIINAAVKRADELRDEAARHVDLANAAAAGAEARAADFLAAADDADKRLKTAEAALAEILAKLGA